MILGRNPRTAAMRACKDHKKEKLGPVLESDDTAAMDKSVLRG